MKQEFWNELQHMRKQYAHMLEQASGAWNMTRAEMDVLMFLANNPTLDRAADIVELRGLTKSHVSIAVKALCDRGFLTTQQDEKDHRVIRLKPTEAAAEVIEAGRAAQCTYYKELFGCFTREEIQQWQYLQKKLLSNMKKLGEIE